MDNERDKDNTSFSRAIGPFTVDDIAEQLRASAKRFASLIDRTSDESATGRHAPDWNAGQIIRHVTFFPAGYISGEENRTLAATAGELKDVNLVNLARNDNLLLSDCREKLLVDVEALIERMVGSQSPEHFPFQAGTTATLPQIAGMALAELEIHGLDLADAIGADWTINADAAAIAVLAAMTSAAPAWVDPQAARGHSGTYEFRLRGGRGRVALKFNDGALTAEALTPNERSSRASTVISADPASLLEVFYGRRSQWSAIARMQMLAWGTRPWNAFTLTFRFLPI